MQSYPDPHPSGAFRKAEGLAPNPLNQPKTGFVIWTQAWAMCARHQHGPKGAQLYHTSQDGHGHIMVDFIYQYIYIYTYQYYVI